MQAAVYGKTFWKKFAETNWEKKPVLVKNFSSSISSIDQNEIFLMLTAYSDLCRKNNNAAGFKLYVDGIRQNEEDILQMLPVHEDKNLKRYHQRMEEFFSDYCLVCDELLQVSEKNQQQLRDFSETLFQHVGFPNRFSEIGLYLGNYRQTPFGVHVDGCGVFSFPVLGKKNFRLWKPEVVEKYPELNRAEEYSKLKKYSQILTAKAGDMTYWPSSAWHIAESNGSFSVTWSLGVWVDRTHQETLTASLQPLLNNKLAAAGQACSTKPQKKDKTGQIKNLPKEYLNSIDVITRITKNEWHDSLLKSWLVLSSKNGFKNSPAKTKKTSVSLTSLIQINKNQKIIWAKLKTEKKILYAFSGELVTNTTSPSFLKLITDLNDEKTCSVSKYLKGPSKNTDLKVLKSLAEMGAFNDLR